MTFFVLRIKYAHIRDIVTQKVCCVMTRMPVSSPFKLFSCRGSPMAQAALIQLSSAQRCFQDQVTNNIPKDNCLLFPRHYIPCQTREGDLHGDEFFKHGNQTCPRSLRKCVFQVTRLSLQTSCSLTESSGWVTRGYWSHLFWWCCSDEHVKARTYENNFQVCF